MATSTNKTIATLVPVDQFIDQLSPSQQQDARQLCRIMSDITSYPPVMWGPSIIGFDTYHYKYDSGREGDMAAVAFSPRKDKFVIYLDEGMPSHHPLLPKLGPYKTGKVCLYIKNLESINVDILRQIITDSYQSVRGQYGRR